MSSAFKISPAGRSTLIIGGFFLGLIGLSTYALYKKASEVRQQRDRTGVVNADSIGEMVWIPGGSFTMGGIGDNVPSDELPLHDVKVNGFWIDKTEVTNEQFQKFTEATKYVTVAERTLSRKTIPDLSPEFEGKTISLCFRAPKPGEQVGNAYQWWEPRIGANWRHPEGEGSDLKGREKHPVVHVCYDDALAFCRWAGKRLPTEAEWEFAARGGLVAQQFMWGPEFRPEGKWMGNVWQGNFPAEKRVEDGFPGTAPVGRFPANGYGLLDMAGNVWELTTDWYRPDTYEKRAKSGSKEERTNPRGPADSWDPDEPGAQKKVTRGGSWMCSDNYCRGYRPSARMKTAVDTGLENTGFRCAKDGPPK